MQKSSNKIVFFGSFEFAVSVLETLVGAGYNIAAVLTNPDKPAGRNQIPSSPPVKLAAQKLNLPVLQPDSLKDLNMVKGLSTVGPDIGIVAAYGKIIPPEIFNLPRHGILVIHPSLLPKYRGPSPVQTAILNGDLNTGVTIMKIDNELDHGDIVAAADYKLSLATFSQEAHAALFKLGAELLIKTLPDYLADKIKPKPQDHSLATFTRKFKAEDGEIKQTDTSETAYRKILAFNPEPGAYVWLENKGKKLRLKILDASFADGKLELKVVQLEGGKAMIAKEFSSGHSNFSENLLY